MRVVRTRAELRAALAGAPRPVGFVPTMGALHDGHRSLVERARAETRTVVVSIFVNPRQFGDPADLAAYPRDEARDLARCEEAGADLVFVPPASEIYPPGFETRIGVGATAAPLEGAARPGHFEGVATVVAILVALTGADRIYLGWKDHQQVRVVERMVLDLGFPTEVVPCPTVREADGLARSSRNLRLSPAGRAAAAVVPRALRAGAALAEGGADADVVRSAIGAELATEPAAGVEYVSVADPVTLVERPGGDALGGPVLLSLAVTIDGVRLIDNVVAEPGRRT